MKIYFISLGCDKNLVDSEEMLGLLSKEGYSFTDNPEEADAIIINTCSFICDAKEESINTIIEMGQYKEMGKCKALIITGCLAQRYKDEIDEELPEVDAIVGINSYTQIARALKEAFNRGGNDKPNIKFFRGINDLEFSDGSQVLTTGGHYAYLKIAEGCDKHCTYCIIPKIRGDFRSIPMENLLKRAKQLADKGVKELILVAQETTMYGTDLYGEKRLHVLISELAKIDGIEWIRLLYAYPEDIYDELIEVFKTEPKLCHYIDMPIQHVNDRVLKLMGRRTSKNDLLNIIKKLRSEIPDIVIRTTLIVGFPSESEEEFAELENFINEISFERLGAFPYSAEENTPAAAFDNQIDEAVKENRFESAMQKQQLISRDFLSSCVGKKLKILVEGKLVDEDAYVGRSYMDAPNVDGNVFFSCYKELMSGDFVEVLITGSSEYDLIGEIVE